MPATLAPRSKGRPRDERRDDAITGAAVHELADHGFGRFAVEAVAERAGVAKTTVYRRFPSRTALLAAALESLNEDLPDLPPPGPVRERLALVLGALTTGQVGVRMRILEQAQASDDPTVLPLVDGLVIAPRRALVRAIVVDAVASGELRAGIDIDAALACLVGPMLLLRSWRRVGCAGDLTPGDLLDVVLDGLGAR